MKYIIEFRRTLTGCADVIADDEESAKREFFLGNIAGFSHGESFQLVIDSVTPALDDDDEEEDEE